LWQRSAANPVTVALFDDGAAIDHEDLSGALWTNERELHGKAGVDDDGNGYVDDIHGWDFVDSTANVAPHGSCVGRPSHGTFMASLIGAGKNGIGIVGAGAGSVRVMVLRVTGCGGDASKVDPERIRRALLYAVNKGARILSFSAHWTQTTPELDAAFAEIADSVGSPRAAVIVASVPNKGEPEAGFPAAYTFRRIVRAVPVGDGDRISPGTSPAPDGLNLAAPSACVLGATAAPAGYGLANGSSNSTAILSGLLAGIWSRAPYATLAPDQFLERVVRSRMMGTPRHTAPGSRPPYLQGLPIADACLLVSRGHGARVCSTGHGTAD
jgi:subtilisin family serine protease